MQTLSTQSDVAGSLVRLNVPASLVAGLATPVSATNPLPIVPTPNTRRIKTLTEFWRHPDGETELASWLRTALHTC